MGGLMSAGQELYNTVEDNRNLQKNYKLEQNKLVHDQQANRERKTNILEQNLAQRRALSRAVSPLL